MQEQNGLNSEQLELEQALRSLLPASARLDPIAAAFEAGQKVRQRQVRAWSSAFVVLFLAASSSLVWMRKPATASNDFDGANPAARAQPQHSNPPGGPRIATVSFEGPSHQLSASSQSTQPHTPIQERMMTYPPQPPPSVLILQQSIEKQGIDQMPTTYLPQTGPMNLSNQL